MKTKLVALLITAQSLTLAGGPQQPPQVPGAFRSRVTIVPLDVRVLDRSGKPVTDLKKEDFTVIEDSVQQEIRHFSGQSLTPQTPEPGARPGLRTAPGDSVASRNQRVFLLVLGRGRLQQPGNNLDGLIAFVRERLLPQDHVAVLAYNRATDFTTDHERVARMIERYKGRHESIETNLVHHFSGLAAILGSREIPEPIQAQIDELFRGPGALASRAATEGRIRDSAALSGDTRRGADALQRAEVVAGRQPGMLTSAGETMEAEMLDMTLEEFMQKSIDTRQDLGRIYAGIEYPRYLGGEKHLVFFTPAGLFLPRLENEKSIAAVASDARVTIDVIHTGGMVAAPAPSPPGTPAFTPLVWSPVPTTGSMFRQTFAVGGSRTISELTGGQTSAFRAADLALRRIDEATRFQYLLGYDPSNSTWDGAYRRITIKVNRPGVTVLHRHGYYGRRELVPFDRRQFLTYTRIAAAGNYTGEIDDIKVTIQAPVVKRDATSQDVLANITIHPSRIAFTQVDGRHVASLDVAFFCIDAKQDLVGELWQKIDLKLREDTYQRFLRDGTVHAARIPVTGPSKYLKVVVYDYTADLVGTAHANVK